MGKVPGVHLVIGPAGISYGSGWYGIEAAALERYRRQVVADRGALEAALGQAAAVGAVLDAPEMVRPPKGYAAAPWDHLLRRKSVIARGEEVPHPGWLFGPDAVAGWMHVVQALAPLALWLARL
jgi:hypothetical protein